MDDRNLPRPVKLTLRMNKLDKIPNELPRWIKGLNPGVNTEHWKVLYRLPEPLGRRTVLLINSDSLKS
jgi:hypothetical protein